MYVVLSRPHSARRRASYSASARARARARDTRGMRMRTSY